MSKTDFLSELAKLAPCWCYKWQVFSLLHSSCSPVADKVHQPSRTTCFIYLVCVCLSFLPYPNEFGSLRGLIFISARGDVSYEVGRWWERVGHGSVGAGQLPCGAELGDQLTSSHRTTSSA